MILQSRFLASKALYAVVLSGLTRRSLPRQKRIEVDDAFVWVDDPEARPLYRYEIPCVWYRRRQGVDTANIGMLWNISWVEYPEHHPSHAEVFLSDFTDGRHGPDCRSRWDGEHLWSFPSITYEQMQDDLELLRWMLDHYPEIPPGFSGWWSFR